MSVPQNIVMNMNNVMFYTYIVWFSRINIQRISNRFLGNFLLDESNITDDSISDGSSSSYSPNFVTDLGLTSNMVFFNSTDR